jgi:aromatic ring-opening dioxygenase catalytic subunit (LigB family)
MPTWYIPHGGGPCFFMEWSPPHAWDRLADFLKNLAATLPRKPKAIVMVSAHWLEPHFAVTSGEQPELVYDDYGFPPHTYELKYLRPVRPPWQRRSCRRGSGMSFHNLRAYGKPQYGPVSNAFDAWLTQVVESNPQERERLLTNWEQAPGARQCHPPRAEEHLIHLMTIAGAAGEGAGRKLFSDRVMETTLSAFSFA